MVEEAPRWRDIWDLCPPLAGSLTIDRLFELCPPTAPRFYSISSSLLASPTEVALTVGQLAYQLPNGEKRRVRRALRSCAGDLCCLSPLTVSPLPVWLFVHRTHYVHVASVHCTRGD